MEYALHYKLPPMEFSFWKLMGAHKFVIGLILHASPMWDLCTPFMRVHGEHLFLHKWIHIDVFRSKIWSGQCTSHF